MFLAYEFSDTAVTKLDIQYVGYIQTIASLKLYIINLGSLNIVIEQ